MIGSSILSNLQTTKVFTIVFVLGGDESADHRTSAYSEWDDNYSTFKKAVLCFRVTLTRSKTSRFGFHFAPAASHG